MHILGGGTSKANTFSLWSLTGYTAQEDLKSVNSYNMGEGRKIKSGFSVLASQDPPWFYLLFCPWVTKLIFNPPWLSIRSSSPVPFEYIVITLLDQKNYIFLKRSSVHMNIPLPCHFYLFALF